MSRLSSWNSHRAIDDTSIDTTVLSEALRAANAYGNDGAFFVQAYEEDLTNAFLVNDAVVVSSDSATVSVLCGALKLRPGGRAAATADLPPWALGALDQAQVEVILFDHDIPEEKLRPIIVFHTYGGDLEAIRRLRVTVSGAGGLLVILLSLQDAEWRPELAEIAHVIIIPTGEGEPVSTGEGGILLFQDRDLAEAARSYAQFGRLDGIRAGANHKLSPVQAAIGRTQLLRFFPRRNCRVDEHGTMLRAEQDKPKGMIPDRFDASSPEDASTLAIALADGLSGSSETVLAYETALMLWFQANHAISVSSGYAAVLVALLALDLKPGDEVLLTPTCPLCTVFALTALGVIPVFCDTESDSFSINLTNARKKISPRTRAVLEIPMWGYPVPAKQVAAFAHENGLPFILDLALGHATELDGELIWRHADIATFSTHGSKILVTGEGGFVLTQNAKIASALQRARHYGGVQRGNNYRLAAPQAALGRARLPTLSKQIQHRRACMTAIERQLNNRYLSVFPSTSGGVPCGVKLLISERDGRGPELNDHLSECGVPSDIKTYRCRPLYQFPVLAERSAECPNAMHLLSSIATLPVHPAIGPDQCELMTAALNSYRGG